MRLGHTCGCDVLRRARRTRVVDAGGATVIPGFIEGHMHLFAGAAELSHLQLYGTRGFAALKARTEAYIRQNPGDDLIIGEQADYVILGEDEPLSPPPPRPHREGPAAASSSRPTIIRPGPTPSRSRGRGCSGAASSAPAMRS